MVPNNGGGRRRTNSFGLTPKPGPCATTLIIAEDIKIDQEFSEAVTRQKKRVHFETPNNGTEQHQNKHGVVAY